MIKSMTTKQFTELLETSADLWDSADLKVGIIVTKNKDSLKAKFADYDLIYAFHAEVNPHLINGVRSISYGELLNAPDLNHPEKLIEEEVDLIVVAGLEVTNINVKAEFSQTVPNILIITD